MRHRIINWTLFGSRAWTYDLPYERRLVFVGIANQYERQGIEPPYSEIRMEVLLLSHEQVRERLDELRSKVKKSVSLVDTLIVDEVGNDEE